MALQSPILFCYQADNSLRPVPTPCRGGFDFSLHFEEVILGVVPVSIISLILPWRIWHLFQKLRKVVPSALEYVKLSTWVCLGMVQLCLTTQWATPSTPRTDASVAANSIFTSAFFLLSLLSYAEHNFSTTPSLLLSVYLFISSLFDIAKTRTLWLWQSGGTSKTIAALTTATLVLKLALLVLESIEKRPILQDEYRAYPPETIGGIFNKSLFWWLNPLFRQGLSKSLIVDDLYVLDKQLSSRRLHLALEAAWDKVAQKDPNILLFLTLKTFKWQICAAILPRTLLVALNFCQPLLLHRSLAFSTEPVNSATNNTGYGLIGAYILVYVGMGVTMGQQQHLTYRAITMIRGAIVSMIYSKACTLNLKDADPAESVTLMSADIERIVQGWQTIHEMWANVAEISLAIFLLERELGVACVVPVGVSLVALAGCLFGMALVVARQALWLEAIERRISATSSMLGSMKGIKMLGLQTYLMKFVHNLRTDELSISKKFRKLLVWNMAFAWLTRIFAPIFAFGAFVGIAHSRGQDDALDTSTVFTALSLFALLADPLLSLVMALMAFAGSVGSFARIQVFLEKESHIDARNEILILPSEPLKASKPLTLVTQLEIALSESGSSTISKGSSSSLPRYMILIQNGSFGWDPQKDSSVNNVTISIPSATFTMLVGPSGCGKSTLLKAILGEVPCQTGAIQLATESVAFCDQSPWHMNGTIRDCIIAMSPLDSTWYNSVINACALTKDLAQLPHGDETVIGSKGISLSGGQSQRIAIARAVYARRELVIFDDVFSGLDTETENHVFQHLLGDHGLLRSINATVLLASSSVKRVPFVDHTIVLDKHGYITEQGSFLALDSAGGYIASFALGRSDTDIKSTTRDKTFSSDMHGYPVGKRSDTESENYRGNGDIAVYLYYIRSIGWLSTIFFFVAITGFIFCISFPSIWVKLWASSNEANPGERTGYYLGIYAMLGVVGMICLCAGTWQMIINMVPKSGEVFHRQLLATVLSAPMLLFSTTDSGSILNRFSQDLQLIDMELPVAAINTFATLVLCLCQMIFMGIASKYAAISFPFVLLIVYTIQKIYLRTSRQLRFLDLEAKAPLYSHFTDSLSGLITLRAFGWQQSLQDKHYQLLDRSQRPFYLLYAVQRWLTLTLDLVVAGIAVLLIVLVVTLRGEISAGYVGVALLNVIMFSQSIKLLVTFWTNLETHIGSIQRVKTFTETVKSEDLPGESNPVPPNWPAQGTIEFTSMSAGYRPDETVLNDINISINAGEKVAICGRTGSGKTSLIMTLFRLIDLHFGTIKIDNIDITTLPRQEIRARLNGVSQSPLLLQGSVRVNACPSINTDTGQGTALSDKEILNALKAVNLHTKVLAAGGLDVSIDELHLSHGQKQLFCLARAILRKGNVLVLDEATSNIDPKTDTLMQRIIREKFASHTILTVAHKLDSVLDYDKVIVLENGRIVEVGVPYELLSGEGGWFRKLFLAGLSDGSGYSFDNDGDGGGGGNKAHGFLLAYCQSPG
ncbi:P-loop containing nucleoside triphosphate hydrolase protein [Aspergillus karnatakaensis]|uniref:putative ABC multidrug transporter n=1 Tax=Aspergillus karnatakaensis TaxID=1810916 RepID=UPI003CCD25EB